jgi:hypothetical protein
LRTKRCAARRLTLGIRAPATPGAAAIYPRDAFQERTARRLAAALVRFDKRPCH